MTDQTDVERVAKAIAFSIRHPFDESIDADDFWEHTWTVGRAEATHQARAAIAALPALGYVHREDIAGMVKPIKWARSHINHWDGDYHSLPTKYAIRGLGNEDYKLIWTGGFAICNSPEVAKSKAEEMNQADVLSALNLDTPQEKHDG